ncbi:nickel pincer cofactor biosynthesis protein LarB [Desulfitibacter alkalitolerans]|uniref:nickel pincer cofactor biosynthesis protein LarB n=1 Tax=Desulfitibacter alkalitolerans TaxID=264641 RepID=UPI000489722A|nr:nickel pincer cofactor biosynthesis protein LarB [Desulfitibacter alkalitolerans]
MNENMIKQLLLAVKTGEMDIEQAVCQFKNLPFEDLGYAKIDHHRQLRKGFPEVIYGEGKTSEHIVNIMKKLKERSCSNVLATRINKEVYEVIKEQLPEAKYYQDARILMIEQGEKKARGCIVILSAGTSDLPVAEEAAITAEAMGNNVVRIYDTGVAGIHRLLAQRERLNQAKVIIVVAGMEGALASVVGGLVDKPIIAVPTSVGYGTSFNGLSALLTMLNSCASGVSVVNIDNGFGAAYSASLINALGEE